MSSIDTAEANEECVGPASERAGKESGCDGCPNQQKCASGEGRQEDPDIPAICERLKDVKHKVLVLSGKGGVGKSTMTAQLAFALAGQGLRVGLLDIDICGPSIPHMLGLTGESIHQSASGWSPVYVSQEGLGPDDDDVELGVMSIGFMLPDKDRAVIWRGPRKNGLIKQFLTDVEWGELDYLLVDTPPGTSDEHISIVQYLSKALGPNDGAVIVSTPQEARAHTHTYTSRPVPHEARTRTRACASGGGGVPPQACPPRHARPRFGPEARAGPEAVHPNPNLTLTLSLTPKPDPSPSPSPSPSPGPSPSAKTIR